MVEYSMHLDTVFQALSDPTRRDMLARLEQCPMTVGELAGKYEVSFAATSKHLKVLESAGLVSKRKEGRSQIVSLEPTALRLADDYLERYRRRWESRYEKLDDLLK